MEVFFHARFFRRVELVPAPLFLAKWSHHAMPSPRGEDAELCSPDAVLPDVTRHGNFVSASLDRYRPPSLLPEEKVPNFVRRMPCCLTSRAMAISFLHRSTGAAPKPSPRGEGAELCSPDAVEASRLPPVPSGACLTSSLVCFCITCQAFFLSERKPASAPCAAPASRTNGRHVAPRPAVPHHAAPQPVDPHHAAPRPAVPHHAAPRPACPAPAPFPAAAGFPQTFHRVFHIFAGFPQWLSFPLAFLERDRVRSSESWVLPAA